MPHAGTITNLRFLKRNQLQSEQQLQRGYYRELIHSYGADTTYFRHDANPYEVPSGFTYDYTYGERSTMSYWLSAPIVVFMESMGDSVILQKFGIETDGDMDAFILIDDFTEQFRDNIGTAEFTTFTDLELSGNIVSGTGILSAEIGNIEISGFTSAAVSGLPSGTVSGIYSGSFVRYPKKHHDLIYKTQSYVDRRVDGTLTGTWSGTLDLSGTGSISGLISGPLAYSTEDPGKNGGPNWKIAPQVGDFFRLDFHDENHEEYEITRVEDRDLQADGLNHLLSKYVWKMTCVRRDPSYENVIGESEVGELAEEEFTRNKIEQNHSHEVTSDDVFDYNNEIVSDVDGIESDDIYGGYDL